MQLLKRISFFFLLNVAVIATITVIGFLIQRFTGISISGSAANGFLPLAGFALLWGMAGSLISLAISRWAAKRTYSIHLFTEENIYQADSKMQLVYSTVKRIAQENNITLPEVGMYESSDPNAFATGPTRNSALVAVSSGLLHAMSSDEIEGVVAHEMAHILNGDMVTSTLLQGVINAFVIFISRALVFVLDRFLASRSDDGQGLGSIAHFGLVFILEQVLFIAGYLVIMAHSRQREFAADNGSARMVGKTKMIHALKKLSTLTSAHRTEDDGQLATFKISTRDVGSLFASHPPLELRIKRLQEDYTF